MKDNKRVHKSFTMVSQISISMLVPICLCSILGIWLQEQTGFPAMVPLFFLGAMAGMRNVYYMVKSIYEDKDRKL